MTNELRHFRLETIEPLGHIVWIDVRDRSVNALSDPVFDDLEIVLDRVSDLSSEQILVFRSGKPSNFIVGADLKQIASLENSQATERFLERGQQLFDRLRDLPHPTVAAIGGPCLGGGLEFAMACDWRFVRNDPKTQLGLPETKLGLIPGWGGTQDLPRVVGLKTGLKLLFSGDSCDPEKALRIGLADKVADREAFDTQLREFLHEIRAGIRPPRRSGGSVAWLEKVVPLRCYLPGSIPTDELRGPAIRTLLEVIQEGRRHGRAAGLAAERERFFALVSSIAVQAELAKFFRPKS